MQRDLRKTILHVLDLYMMEHTSVEGADEADILGIELGARSVDPVREPKSVGNA